MEDDSKPETRETLMGNYSPQKTTFVNFNIFLGGGGFAKVATSLAVLTVMQWTLAEVGNTPEPS